jgi:cell division protein FtsZ
MKKSTEKLALNIKVVGVGGSGGNAISRMKKAKIKGVELIAMNTDYQDLKKIRADAKVRIGEKISQGLGAGMKPQIGELAAKESKDRIYDSLKGADMVFIAGGLGGGTGSGASPVIAQIAKSIGALTVVIATLPFSFEGLYRRKIAEASKRSLQQKVDALLIIQNDKLLHYLDPTTSLSDAFWFCDDILREAVKGISDLIMLPGIVNVDFADVRSILKNSGSVLFGMGKSKGEKRALEATNFALNSPLLDIEPRGAKGVLFNVSGNEDISLFEIEEIGNLITKEINPKARVVFGAVQDEQLKKGEIKVTVIVTGF